MQKIKVISKKRKYAYLLSLSLSLSLLLGLDDHCHCYVSQSEKSPVCLLSLLELLDYSVLHMHFFVIQYITNYVCLKRNGENVTNDLFFNKIK